MLDQEMALTYRFPLCSSEIVLFPVRYVAAVASSVALTVQPSPFRFELIRIIKKQLQQLKRGSFSLVLSFGIHLGPAV